MLNQNILQDALKQNFVKVLGLDDLSEEKKLALMEKITGIIQKRMVIRITNELKDEDKDEFIKMSEEKNQDVLASFLQTKIPNLNEIITEEITNIKQELLLNK